MDRELEIALIRRVLAHVEARTTDRDPAPTTIDAAEYAPDEARHAREMERIFRRLPLPIGRGASIPSPGDFFVHDETGVPLLVVRGDDGRASAFLNVCRHRGTRVEGLPCGNKRSFVCPYHAWTYGRDGSLRGIPHAGGFEGVDRDARGLVRVPCAEAAGFVWAVPSPAEPAARDARDAPEPLDPLAWLGPIASDLDFFGVTAAHAHRTTTFTKELSWKLAVDVFLEAYHLKPTHAGSIYSLFFDNLGLVDRVGPHLRNVFPKRTIRDLRSVPEREWSLRRHANVLFHVFPSTFVLVEPDHAQAVLVLPDGPARSTITTYMLLDEAPATDKARAYWAANDKILRDATDEDFAMGESIQRGLPSGANTSFVFGAFEHALAHFHREIRERVA
jgi:phenylpropionate dioxygenase-like ring-hydroxylating dioxygenase large terminal subunit